MSDILDHFESAFVSEALLDRLSKAANTMQHSDSSTETLIAIEDHYLVKYEMITHTPENTSFMSIRFHHIGNTETDPEQLNDLLSRAKI